MSEWVDFGLYSLQAVLLWIVVPHWGAGFLHPLVSEGTSRARHGRWWLNGLRAWGALSVLALLAYRLGKVPPPLSAGSLRRSGFEALLMTSNLMLALGLLFAAFGMWRFVRWLQQCAWVPENPPEASFALSRDDLLSRRLQYLTYALVLCALVARPIVAAILPGRLQDIWGNFFTGLVLAALLFLAAAGSVLRAPNRIDRMLGARYRQLEVGFCYLLMANLALLELAGLALELAGLESRRHVALLVAGFVCVTLGGLLLLASRPPFNAREGAAAARAARLLSE